MNGINILKKETPESSITTSTLQDLGTRLLSVNQEAGSH